MLPFLDLNLCVFPASFGITSAPPLLLPLRSSVSAAALRAAAAAAAPQSRSDDLLRCCTFPVELEPLTLTAPSTAAPVSPKKKMQKTVTVATPIGCTRRELGSAAGSSSGT